MPIVVVCPGCSAKLNAPDATAGKSVKCPRSGCGTTMAVPESEPAGFEEVDPVVPPKKPKPKVVIAEIEEDHDYKRPKSRRRRDYDDEDDDYDDDFDDEDDRPRKRKKKKSRKAGMSPGLVAGMVLGGVLLLAAVGTGIYFATQTKPNVENRAAAVAPAAGSEAIKAPKAAVPKGFVAFKSESGGFKAYFPVKPEEKGLGNAMKSFDGEDKNAKISGSVLVLTLPANVPEGMRRAAGERAFTKLMDLAKGKILSAGTGLLAGQQASEFLVESPPDRKASKGDADEPPAKNGNGRGVFRLIVVEDKVFVAGFTSDTGMPKQELSDGFFDNFELLN